MTLYFYILQFFFILRYLQYDLGRVLVAVIHGHLKNSYPSTPLENMHSPKIFLSNNMGSMAHQMNLKTPNPHLF